MNLSIYTDQSFNIQQTKHYFKKSDRDRAIQDLQCDEQDDTLRLPLIIFQLLTEAFIKIR